MIERSIIQDHEGSQPYRQLIECNSTIKTALDARDESMFDLLVQELE